MYQENLNYWTEPIEIGISECGTFLLLILTKIKKLQPSKVDFTLQ